MTALWLRTTLRKQLLGHPRAMPGVWGRFALHRILPRKEFMGSMPAVEPFERISGRAKSPLRRIAAGNRGGQLLIAPGRLVHDGCHELRVCETRARQSRGKVFRPSASTVDNHGRAQRTDGNDPSKCVLVDHDGLLFL